MSKYMGHMQRIETIDVDILKLKTAIFEIENLTVRPNNEFKITKNGPVNKDRLIYIIQSEDKKIKLKIVTVPQ